MSSTMTVAESPAEIADHKLATFLDVAQRHRGKLLRWVQCTTSYHQEAEDIVQEALLKAYRALPNFRGDARMDTWLNTITRNAIREFVRNRKRRIEMFVDPPPLQDSGMPANEFPDPGESPEEYCERRELEKVLHSGMNEVTPLCRLALQRCVLQDLPYHEVASDLNVSMATLKSRVFQGRRMLKKAVRRMTCGMVGARQE